MRIGVSSLYGAICKPWLSGLTCAVAIASLLVPSSSLGQQVSSSARSGYVQAGSDQPTGEATPGRGEESSSRLGYTAKTVLPEPQVLAIRKAKPLDTTRSRMRWGRLSLLSADLLQVVDQIHLGNGATDFTRKTTVVGAYLAYDRDLSRGRLAVQYLARAPVVDRPVRSNYSDQDLGVNLNFYLTPRWALSFINQLSRQDTRNLYGDANLDGDISTETFVQQDFLERSGRYLSNITVVNLSYKLSARTEVSFAPSYEYSSVGESAVLPKAVSSRAYGGQFGLTHTLSPRATVGVFYSAHLSQYTPDIPRSAYQTLGLRYSRQLSATWQMTGSLGVSRGVQGKDPKQWNYSANFGLSKRFQRSSLWLAYDRSQSNGGFITNHFGDRVDLGYTTLISRRLQGGASIGYFRETGGVPKISGKYAILQVSYRLTSTLNLFTAYTRQYQFGNGTQVLTGTHNIFSTGIRWEPRSSVDSF